MTQILVGNAPCSWGALEFDSTQSRPILYDQMLDELVETGYVGSELGDWAYMPTEPDALAEEFRSRDLTLTGAFVGVAFREAAAHRQGLDVALKTARLIAAVADALKSDIRPFLVLADDNGTVPVRTQNAGRITQDMGLGSSHWRIFSSGVDEIARAVKEETGLNTVFHPHCAGYVETPDEIGMLMERTDPDVVGLVFDTGHYAFGAGGCSTLLAALDRFSERIDYIHFKDCDPLILERARSGNWNYFESVRQGVFCELGQGCVDFGAVLAWLKQHDYDGLVTVEQDVLPGMGTPKESAERNREYLRSLGL